MEPREMGFWYFTLKLWIKIPNKWTQINVVVFLFQPDEQVVRWKVNHKPLNRDVALLTTSKVALEIDVRNPKNAIQNANQLC